MVVPLAGYNGPPPHRADVRFDDPREIFSCGVSFRFPVAHCHKVFQADLVVVTAAVLLGCAPDSLMIRITTALRRELSNRALESRLHHNDGRINPARMVA